MGVLLIIDKSVFLTLSEYFEKWELIGLNYNILSTVLPVLVGMCVCLE